MPGPLASPSTSMNPPDPNGARALFIVLSGWAAVLVVGLVGTILQSDALVTKSHAGMVAFVVVVYALLASAVGAVMAMISLWRNRGGWKALVALGAASIALYSTLHFLLTVSMGAIVQ